MIVGPVSATLLSTYISHPAHSVSEKSNLFSAYIQTLDYFPHTHTMAPTRERETHDFASKCVGLRVT